MRLVLLLVVCAGHVAQAQPDSAQAERLFQRGKQLLARGEIARACEAFDASQRLGPTVSTLLNQGNCREKHGRLATALGHYLEAERRTRAATDRIGKQLHQIAVGKIAKLEPRVSRLTVAVAERLDGLEVTRDGAAVDPGAWGVALPIDGGTYTIAARAPGRAPWSQQVTIAQARASVTVAVPVLPREAIAPAPPPPAPASQPAPALPREPAPRSRVVPIVLGVAALALGAGAVGFELAARDVYAEAEVEPDDAAQESRWRSANTRRYVAEGMAIAGVTCAGLAIWTYVRGGSEPRVRVAPVVSGDRAGFAVGGRF